MSRSRTLIGTLLALWSLYGGYSGARAEVQFDGLAGAPSGVISGDLVISEADGRLTANQDALLHSFTLFNVLADESISFTHVTPSVANIIARVTGSTASRLDGWLSSDANLWLLNPNGVLVGANAAIDVAGTFRSNTATGEGVALILSDGTTLSVDTDLNSLTVARPADFGFVTDVPADPLQRVRADSTLQTLVTPQPIAMGTRFMIEGGTVAGANLFHSFDRFSVFDQDIADFQSTAVLPFDNVISRVTGDFKTFLTGTVRTSGSGFVGTSFWFVNPAGLFAGNGAVFDVAKSLNLGAADYVETSLGERFSVGLNAPLTLFDVAPQSFGFDVDSNAGDLRLVDFVFDQEGRVANSTQDGVSFAGQNVTLQDVELNMLADNNNVGQLNIDAPGGTLELLDSNITHVSTSGLGAERIELRGARLVANGTQILVQVTDGSLPEAPRAIQSVFSESVVLTDSDLVAETNGVASSGNVTIAAPVLFMRNGSLVTQTQGAGAADPIIVVADGELSQITLEGEVLISNSALQGIDGATSAGIFLFTDGTLSVVGDADQAARIIGSAGPLASAGASVRLQGESVTLTDLVITTDSESTIVGEVEGARISIAAVDRLDLSSTDLSSNTTGSISSRGVVLEGRVITIEGGLLSGATSGSGNAGVVQVTADEQLLLSGSIAVDTGTTSAGAGADIVFLSLGDIAVQGDNLSISSDSVAQIGGGTAGAILLFAVGDLSLSGTEISASAISGAAGFAVLQSRNLSVEGSSISIASQSDVPSPNRMALIASDALSVRNTTLTATTAGSADSLPISIEGVSIQISDSIIQGSTTGAGDAGPIFINGPSFAENPELTQIDIEITNTTIASASSGVGAFGTIGINADNLSLLNTNLRVETSSLSSNQGEQELAAVLLTGVNSLEIRNSSVSGRSTGNSDAGRLVLAGQNTQVEASTVSSSSTGAGSAGRILFGSFDLSMPSALLLVDSQISSDTVDGGAGEVNLTSDTITFTGAQTRISTNTSGAAMAGNILIAGGSLGLLNGASIESRATGSGDSNNIRIEVLGGLQLLGDAAGARSEVLTDSVRSQGGDVVIITGTGSLFGNSVIAASAGADGTGGNIRLSLNGLVVAKSALLAQAVNGNGGLIDIAVPDGALFIVDAETVVSADSQAGTAGSVQIDAPDTGITSALSPHVTSLVAQPALQSDACGDARGDERRSTLYVRAAGPKSSGPDTYLGLHQDIANTDSITDPRSSGCK